MTTLTRLLIETSVNTCARHFKDSVSLEIAPKKAKYVPLPIGLRDIQLSHEAANRIRGILEDTTIVGKAGRQMETVDSALLFE